MIWQPGLLGYNKENVNKPFALSSQCSEPGECWRKGPPWLGAQTPALGRMSLSYSLMHELGQVVHLMVLQFTHLSGGNRGCVSEGSCEIIREKASKE